MRTESIHNSSPTNKNSKTSVGSNPLPHRGFSITTDAVSEEAWEEIRSYLGLLTTPLNPDQHSRDVSNLVEPSIKILELSKGTRSCSSSEDLNDCDENIAVTSRLTTKIPWESTPSPQNRPVAQFGFRYDYERDVVVLPTTDNENSNEEEAVPKIPGIFQRLLLRPYRDNIQPKFESTHISEFTQCIVNVYYPSTTEPSQNHSEVLDPQKATPSTTTSSCSSIPWHVDDSQFGPEIVVFTFGETRPLHMRLKCDKFGSCSNARPKTKYDNGNECDLHKEFLYYTANPSHRSCYVLSGPARYEWQHSVPSGSGWRVSITFRTSCNQ